MFFLIKLLLLPIWLPFKILGEIIEHSGHHRRYHRKVRVDWTPGRAGLSQWTSSILRSVDTTPAQKFIARPLVTIAVTCGDSRPGRAGLTRNPGPWRSGSSSFSLSNPARIKNVRIT